MKRPSRERRIPDPSIARGDGNRDIPVLHTPTGVARLAGVDPSTVRLFAMSGRAPGVYQLSTGGRLVFDGAFVSAFLARHES
ncbi:MAG: hypothetical protein JSR73_12125 [Proteobacteria bacterium]|nr:hypothetical protein [Pseudomonadota bacterium]